MLVERIIGEGKTVLLFSDGGPKHFKNSAVMWFMSLLSEKYHLNTYWSFFGANHGSNVCDAVGSHANRKIKTESMNKQTVIQAKDIPTHINLMKNHTASIAPKGGNYKVTRPNTLQGIRMLHYWTFFGDVVRAAETYENHTNVNEYRIDEKTKIELIDIINE